MKAILVRETGASNVMQLEEVPKPAPGAGEVLVRVHAAGVNPVDTYIRAGNYGKVNLPYTPGLDGAGVVDEVGEGVTGWKAGDRVYMAGTLSGSYAEYALCRAGQIHRLPESMSFEQGAGVYVPYATAFRALMHKAGARGGDKVLIHGASGGVGTAAVQIARAYGMDVTGTAGTEQGMELVREQGAHHVYDHTKAGYLERAMQEATGGRGFNVIIEMLANVNLDNDLDVLAPEGRVVVVGSRGRVEIDPRKMMGKNSSIVGMTVVNTSEADAAAIHAALIAGMESGTLNPIVGKRFSLGEAAAGHDAVLEPGAHGKIVLIP